MEEYIKQLIEDLRVASYGDNENILCNLSRADSRAEVTRKTVEMMQKMKIEPVT